MQSHFLKIAEAGGQALERVHAIAVILFHDKPSCADAGGGGEDAKEIEIALTDGSHLLDAVARVGHVFEVQARHAAGALVDPRDGVAAAVGSNTYPVP